MKIIFFGTPGFAVPSLEAIVHAGFDVAAVVTAPDKPSGRGMALTPSPVKKSAEAFNLPVLQPRNLKDPTFTEELKKYGADLHVVIAFRMLPETVWNMPPKGTINLHASLLPDYRGAAPINWAIIQGETETGITTFFLKHEIDTGDIILREKTAITPDMTAGELHDILMEKGAALIVSTLKAIESGNIHPQPQGKWSAKKAPKIFTEDCKINWTDTGEHIRNLVRGLSPYPGAFTVLDGKTLKVYKASFIPVTDIPDPGTPDTDHKTYLRFACKDGWIQVEELQVQDKKKMPVKDFLIGYRA